MVAPDAIQRGRTSKQCYMRVMRLRSGDATGVGVQCLFAPPRNTYYSKYVLLTDRRFGFIREDERDTSPLLEDNLPHGYRALGARFETKDFDITQPSGSSGEHIHASGEPQPGLVGPSAIGQLQRCVATVSE